VLGKRRPTGPTPTRRRHDESFWGGGWRADLRGKAPYLIKTGLL
jgi:hypothetical protein